MPATTVTFAATPAVLAALFLAESDPPLVVGHRDRGGRVFEDECVELFVERPGEPGRYLEVVANPAAALYTARVANPDGSRRTWSVEPVLLPGVRVRVAGRPRGASPSSYGTWRCRLEVPWREIGGGPPPDGGELRANAFRIARGAAPRFLALSPTFRADPPDFHVPARFARLRFTGLL